MANESFEDGTVYWPELKASSIESGRYLIFTCACGVAEDAGWELVKVTHTISEVIWEFDRNGDQKFTFDKSNYLVQIEACENSMNLSEYPLAVEQAIFPELNDENT